MKMRTYTLKTVLAAMACLTAFPVCAQDTYLTQADKPFDFRSARNFVVLYAPSEAVEAMGDRIVGNNNLDPTTVNNQFYYWTTDWDKTSLVLANVEEPDGKNSLGGNDYINMTPLYEWGGGSFAAKGSWRYDLSKVTDRMVLHVGLRDFGSVAPKFKIAVGKMSAIKSNGFMLETNLPVGAEDGDYMGVGSMGHDSQWYYLEIPVKDLVDPMGQYGFSYDFTGVFGASEAAVQLSFATPQVTKATGILEPGHEVKTYTITELGSAMSVDGIWFYEKDEATGISQMSTGTPQACEVYDLGGHRVDGKQLPAGIYIVKSGGEVRKMVVR